MLPRPAGNDRSAATYARGNSMGKTRMAISAIVLGVTIGSTGVASAAPVAECSSGFEAMTIRQVLRTIAAPSFDPQAFFDEDRNGDNRLCIKIIPNEGGPPQFDPAFVFVDNHI
jgi:hypothetical protein